MSNKDILENKPDGAVSVDSDGGFFNSHSVMWDVKCGDFDYHVRPEHPVRSIADIE